MQNSSTIISHLVLTVEEIITFLLLLPPHPHLQVRKQQIVFIGHVPVTSTFSNSLNPCNSVINLVVLYTFDRWEH